MAVTFLMSGFVLHDLPFGNGIDVLRGTGALPENTILLGIFGAMSIVTDAAGIRLSRCRAALRVAANAGLLLIGFALRRLVIAVVSQA